MWTSLWFINIHLTGGRPAYLGCYLSAQPLFCQCPKLRVHPAPGAHISTTRCTVFGGVHPVCARFLSHLLLLYVGKVHEAIYGCTVLWEVQPASAQNKSLILDTVCVSVIFFGHFPFFFYQCVHLSNKSPFPNNMY